MRRLILFAGSDGGAEHWGTIVSLIETCKLNDIDPTASLTDALTKIANGHPNRHIDQLMPGAYRKQDLSSGLKTALTAVARPGAVKALDREHAPFGKINDVRFGTGKPKALARARH